MIKKDKETEQKILSWESQKIASDFGYRTGRMEFIKKPNPYNLIRSKFRWQKDDPNHYENTRHCCKLKLVTRVQLDAHIMQKEEFHKWELVMGTDGVTRGVCSICGKVNVKRKRG